MSFDDDDDDEFGGDDLFSHPDLLASLEKVEREHKTVNVVKETSRTPGSVAGNSSRSAGGGGGYHHAVARPAIHARGRGRAPQSNHIARPTTSHLAPQPVHRNPQQTAVQLQPQPQPQPRLQSRAQPQPTRLALKPAPIPVPFQEEESDDDDYAMAMDVLVNEEGKYMVVPQVQQDRPIANLPKPVSSPSVPPQAPAPALVPVPAPVPISSDRQLGRSTSLNFDSQSQSLQRQRQQQQQQQQQRPGSSSQAYNSQGAGGSQWKRTMSADQLARKQAIEKAVGSGSAAGALGSNAVAAQTVARPTVINSSRPSDTSAHVQPNVTSEPAAVNPGEAARLQAELEALRQKLRETELEAEEQVLAFKREAQKRHGEAVYVRTQLDEVTRKSEEAISELKQNQLSAQEEVKRLQTEHKKQLDSVQSQHTFDVHNNKAHKFFPSQKTAGIGRMTPGRGGSSQFPQAIAPFQTPSRSPGRSQRSPRSNRKWQAELMPPPPPPAFVDPNRFKTPGRAGTSQRKGKDRLDLKPAASPSFSNLQDSFHVDPNVELDRLSKRAKQTHVGSALPPFDEDDRRGDAKSSPPYDGGFALDLDPMPYPPAQTDEPEQFQVERSDADLRGEVIHVLFEHAYVPADAGPERPHITTIQRLLNIQTAHILPDFEQDAYDTACTGLWDAIGDNRLSAKETCAVLVENLVDAMVILCRCNLTLPMVAVMRLVVYMAHSLSLFDDLQERIASSIPGDQLVVIARYCKQDRPVQVGKTLVAKARTTKTVPAPTAKAAARNDDLNEIDTPEPVKVERVEIGRALIALASVLGVDLNPPSEVLSTFVSDLAGLQLLLKPDQPVDLVIDAVDLTLAFSSYPDFFRQLLVLLPANEARDSNSSDSTRPPLVELLCGHLRTRHPEANDTINNMIQLRVLCIFSTMCSVESDALTLLANSYFLVPTLISFLVDQSEKIWGVATSTELVEESLRLLIPALSLLHHLVFPPAFGPDIHDPSAPTRTGVNLMERLAELLKTREFGSLHHSFYTALPRITYADIGEDLEGWDPEELKDMQDLAGDILEGLIDAPEEGDGILEMYRPVNEMEAGLRSADDQDVEIIESMGIDPGLEDETEARNLASPVEDQRQGR